MSWDFCELVFNLSLSWERGTFFVKPFPPFGAVLVVDWKTFTCVFFIGVFCSFLKIDMSIEKGSLKGSTFSFVSILRHSWNSVGNQPWLHFESVQQVLHTEFNCSMFCEKILHWCRLGFASEEISPRKEPKFCLTFATHVFSEEQPAWTTWTAFARYCTSIVHAPASHWEHVYQLNFFTKQLTDLSSPLSQHSSKLFSWQLQHSFAKSLFSNDLCAPKMKPETISADKIWNSFIFIGRDVKIMNTGMKHVGLAVGFIYEM